MKILLNLDTSIVCSITKTNFLLLILLFFFSCTESSSSVNPVSDTPTTAATTTLPSVDYGVSGDFYIGLLNANLLLEQKTDFGSQATFFINPPLPSGLTIDSTSGDISGTPTVQSLPTKYTVTASSDGKDYTIKMITLGVASSLVWVTNVDSSKPYELTAYVVGDSSQQVNDWTWSSSDTSLATVNNNGVVTIQSTSKSGFVVITASKDSKSGSISLTVGNPSTTNPPTTPPITLLSINYNTGDSYTALVNTNLLLRQTTDFGGKARFFVSPALPNGLSLDAISGSIRGTPTTSSLPFGYTIRTSLNGALYTKVISLGVAASQVWVTNVDSSKPYELTAYVVGDSSKQVGISWSSSDTSLATVNNNGVVTIQSSPVGGDVVITATTSDGYSQGVSFAVAKDPTAPSRASLSINYNIGGLYYAVVNANLLLRQTTSFGGQARFSVSPTLPNGLSLDTTSGSISGTPTVLSLPTSYTVTATTSSSSYTKVISLGVAASQVWVTNVDSAKPYELTAYVAGDSSKQVGINWSSTDISLATVDNNGVVTIQNSPVGGNVVIIATTSDGLYSQRVSFTVARTHVDYDVIGDFYMALANTNILLEQKTDFGSSARFTISPSLPNGLSLDTTSGSISGRATTLSLPVRYTVTVAIGGKNYANKVITLGITPRQVWVANTDSAKPYELKAYVMGDLTQQAGVSWRSSDTSFATVNNNGVVSLVSTTTGGTVVISATKNGYSDDISITLGGLVGSQTVVIGTSRHLTIRNGVITVTNDQFYSKDLTSVVIPNSVANIGYRAFANNKLTSVVIPYSVTNIGYRAFDNNKLTSVVIPNSVVNIGYRAFANNKLTSVVISDSVKYVGDQAFANNYNLTSVVIPDSVIAIGDEAFARVMLTNLVIGNSVTTIGSKAFHKNKLSSVFIPDSVTNIGLGAFTGILLEPSEAIRLINDVDEFTGDLLVTVSLKQSFYDSLGSRGRRSVFGGQVINYIRRP